MAKLDILFEQCDICKQSATKEDCKKCEKRQEIKYLMELEAEKEAEASE